MLRVLTHRVLCKKEVGDDDETGSDRVVGLECGQRCSERSMTATARWTTAATSKLELAMYDCVVEERLNGGRMYG